MSRLPRLLDCCMCTVANCMPEGGNRGQVVRLPPRVKSVFQCSEVYLLTATAHNVGVDVARFFVV